MEIKTKLSLGSEFWVMYANKPKRFFVYQFKIEAHRPTPTKGSSNIPPDQLSIKYFGHDGLYNSNAVEIECYESDTFLSKEELIASL